jgi:hypothetical protein
MGSFTRARDKSCASTMVLAVSSRARVTRGHHVTTTIPSQLWKMPQFIDISTDDFDELFESASFGNEDEAVDDIECFLEHADEIRSDILESFDDYVEFQKIRKRKHAQLRDELDCIDIRKLRETVQSFRSGKKLAEFMLNTFKHVLELSDGHEPFFHHRVLDIDLIDYVKEINESDSKPTLKAMKAELHDLLKLGEESDEEPDEESDEESQ